MLHEVKEYSNALLFLQNAIDLQKKWVIVFLTHLQYSPFSTQGTMAMTLFGWQWRKGALSHISVALLSYPFRYHLMTCSLTCRGDLRQALQNEKISHTIYKSKVSQIALACNCYVTSACFPLAWWWPSVHDWELPVSDASHRESCVSAKTGNL